MGIVRGAFKTGEGKGEGEGQGACGRRLEVGKSFAQNLSKNYLNLKYGFAPL